MSLLGRGCVKGLLQRDVLAFNFLGDLVLRDFWIIYQCWVIPLLSLGSWEALG